MVGPLTKVLQECHTPAVHVITSSWCCHPWPSHQSSCTDHVLQVMMSCAPSQHDLANASLLMCAGVALLEVWLTTNVYNWCTQCISVYSWCASCNNVYNKCTLHTEDEQHVQGLKERQDYNGLQLVYNSTHEIWSSFQSQNVYFHSQKSSLHCESKLSNVRGQCKRVSTSWRCFKCRQDGNRVKECTCAADKTTTIMHVRCTFVDKLTAIEWNSVPVPGSFVDCCLLHVGSGSNHNPHLTLLLQSPTGLCLTCEHTQDAVMYEMFTCMYGTWIPYICVIYLSVNGFIW